MKHSFKTISILAFASLLELPLLAAACADKTYDQLQGTTCTIGNLQFSFEQFSGTVSANTVAVHFLANGFQTSSTAVPSTVSSPNLAGYSFPYYLTDLTGTVTALAVSGSTGSVVPGSPAATGNLSDAGYGITLCFVLPPGCSGACSDTIVQASGPSCSLAGQIRALLEAQAFPYYDSSATFQQNPPINTAGAAIINGWGVVYGYYLFAKGTGATAGLPNSTVTFTFTST
jgi:hypothetical protein